MNDTTSLPFHLFGGFLAKTSFLVIHFLSGGTQQKFWRDFVVPEPDQARRFRHRAEELHGSRPVGPDLDQCSQTGTNFTRGWPAVLVWMY